MKKRSSKTIDPRFKLRLETTKILNSRWGKCLEPHWQCKAEPIYAHSIQNARIIDRIAEDGHVTTMSVTYRPNSPPFPDFGRVGRNKATTFEGFCAKHDSEVFRRIDVEPIDTSDQEQLFLLAYRAATRELYTTMSMAVRAQASYKTAVGLGLLPANQPSDLGMFAVQRGMIAFETYEYRAFFDGDLITGQYDRMRHKVFNVPCSRPTIAVNSLFSVDSVASGDGCLLISLSILPLEDNMTVAIFSWRDFHNDSAVGWLNKSLPHGTSGEDVRRHLSRIVLENCENIIFAPSFVDGFSADMKKRIRDYYIVTAFTPEGKTPPLEVDLFA